MAFDIKKALLEISGENKWLLDEDAVTIFTDKNRYFIQYRDDYMGCVMTSRKPRAGETWTRGSDLADGDYSIKTWRRILNDIIGKEMRIISKEKPLN